MDVRALELSDDVALGAAYVVECAATAHCRPGWVPLGEAPRLTAWRASAGWSRRLLGAFVAGELVGVASCATADDTPDTAWVDVSVSPLRQGAGVGSALVRAAEALAGPGVTRLVGSVYRPFSHDIDRLVRAFAGPLGYTVATTETVVELDLERAELEPSPPHDGFVVETHVNGVPEHLRAEVGVLKGLVDAETPHGELGWQPSAVSPEEYAQELATWLRQERTAVESVALDDSGAVAAWTCLLLPANPARPAQVEGTLVLADHRGKRLGTAVKVSSLLAARERGVRRVRTSSDDGNEWMRAINGELGFVAVESEALLHKTVTSG